VKWRSSSDAGISPGVPLKQFRAQWGPSRAVGNDYPAYHTVIETVVGIASRSGSMPPFRDRSGGVLQAPRLAGLQSVADRPLSELSYSQNRRAVRARQRRDACCRWMSVRRPRRCSADLCMVRTADPRGGDCLATHTGRNGARPHESLSGGRVVYAGRIRRCLPIQERLVNSAGAGDRRRAALRPAGAWISTVSRR
jgi:hypothetical protein